MSPEKAPAGTLARLAGLAYRRRGRVVLAWVGLLVAVLVLSPMLAGEYQADFDTSGSQSAQASQLIAERFPGRTGDTVTVAWQDRGGVREAPVPDRMEAFFDQAQRLEGIGTAAPPRTSRDGTIAVAELELEQRGFNLPVEVAKDLIALSERTGGEGLRVELGGGPIEEAQEGGSPESVGLLLAAVILLVAFGSIVAAGLPLAVALSGLAISASLIGVLAAVIDTPDFAPAVAGLIGIGVGIDYALLILTRFRSALGAGASPEAAIIEAIATAGRSVLVAGGTVIISVLGLFLVGVSYLQGVAVAASLSVLVVLAASLTLLPALLGFAGHRVNRLRIPGLAGTLARTDSSTENTPAARWSRSVQRRPWTAAIAGTLICLALAAPVTGLRLGFPDAGNDPVGSSTRDAYDLVSEAFGPGANGPLIVVADLRGGGDVATLKSLAERLRSEPAVTSVSEPQANRAGDSALFTVTSRYTPQDSRTEDLITKLRDDVIPATLGDDPIKVVTGGQSAAFIDQSQLIAQRLPLFVGGVVMLSFLLLLLAFRAPIVALKAALMNLLSIGAAYGVISLFANGGFLGGLIGIDGEVPIAPFIPVMMFAILFGLSMDYEVFLLSRVREEFLRCGDTARAVTDGLAKTARVITAAAAIMIAVFLAFVTAPESFLKLLGVGMASAILVDATIVRMILVPAVMQLLGRRNWWLPSWLDRALPHLDVEPAHGAPSG